MNRQTLIEQTHFLADYLEPVYQGIKAEVEDAPVIHAGETPLKMLEGEAKSWEILGSNAFSGYEKATKGTKIKNFFCNAHARRKFVEAELSYPEESPIVKFYADLYEVESEIVNLKPEDKKI